MRVRAPFRLLALCLFALLFAPSRARADAGIDAGSSDAGADARLVDANPALTLTASDAAIEAEADDAAEPTVLVAAVADAEVEAAPAVEALVPPPVASATEAPKPRIEGFGVKLRDKKLFAIRVELSGVSAEDRARKASAALDLAFEEHADAEVKVDESQPGLAVILVGETPIVQLTQADADAAGDASLSAHALAAADSIRESFKSERTRRDIAQTVFSWSLVVFTALIAFLVQRRAREISGKARRWIKVHPDKLPVLRVGSVEILRPAAFQGVIQIGFSLVERALQLTLLYVWLVFVLSLFDATRGVGKRVTGFVLTPLGALASRIAMGLPGIVAGVVTVGVVLVVLRFSGLFFQSVERGETQLEWLPKHLARPVGFLTRMLILAMALLLGAPLVTGSDEGVSGRIATVFLAAFGLAAVPILASASLGLVMIFAGRLRVGDFVVFDGRQGRVAQMTLLELRIHDGEGSEMRVPYLLTLVRPIRVLGPYRLTTLEIAVDAKADQTRVREILTTAQKGKHGAPRIRLMGFDAEGARYEIIAKRAIDEEDPSIAIIKALEDAGIGLGRMRTT